MTLLQKILIVLPVLVVASPALAVSDESHSRSTGDVVSEITASQNISNQSDINCDAVTDEQFEELGDAVMQVMIGNDEAHEAMDNTMGGEGSESLRLMHIAMGQRYLGCAQGQFGTMGMMGGMMSLGWRGGDRSMMGNFYGPWGMAGLGVTSMLFFWATVIVGGGLFIAWLSRQQNARVRGKSALDILQERYAKSEISKEEFEEKKKDLN